MVREFILLRFAQTETFEVHHLDCLTPGFGDSGVNDETPLCVFLISHHLIQNFSTRISPLLQKNLSKLEKGKPFPCFVIEELSLLRLKKKASDSALLTDKKESSSAARELGNQLCSYNS